MVGTLPPGSGHLPTVKVFSHFFPFGCSLVSEGADRAGIDSTGRQKMKILGHICASQTLFLTFSVFKASLVVGGCQCQRVSTAFPAWKGDGCMKHSNHLAVTARVTRRVARSCWEHIGYAWRDIRIGRGQNIGMGWSDPTFGHDSVPKVNRGSLQPNKKISSVRAVRIWSKQVKKVGITYFSLVFSSFFSL